MHSSLSKEDREDKAQRQVQTGVVNVQDSEKLTGTGNGLRQSCSQTKLSAMPFGSTMHMCACLYSFTYPYIAMLFICCLIFSRRFRLPHCRGSAGSEHTRSGRSSRQAQLDGGADRYEGRIYVLSLLINWDQWEVCNYLWVEWNCHISQFISCLQNVCAVLHAC